ncbi:hypothetical protein PAYE108092_19970 [Paracoccus yeei]
MPCAGRGATVGNRPRAAAGLCRHRIHAGPGAGADRAGPAAGRRLDRLQCAGPGSGLHPLPDGGRNRHRPLFRPLARAQGLRGAVRGDAGRRLGRGAAGAGQGGARRQVPGQAACDEPAGRPGRRDRRRQPQGLRGLSHHAVGRPHPVRGHPRPDAPETGRGRHRHRPEAGAKGLCAEAAPHRGPGHAAGVADPAGRLEGRARRAQGQAQAGAVAAGRAYPPRCRAGAEGGLGSAGRGQFDQRARGRDFREPRQPRPDSGGRSGGAQLHRAERFPQCQPRPAKDLVGAAAPLGRRHLCRDRSGRDPGRPPAPVRGPDPSEPRTRGIQASARRTAACGRGFPGRPPRAGGHPGQAPDRAVAVDPGGGRAGRGRGRRPSARDSGPRHDRQPRPAMGLRQVPQRHGGLGPGLRQLRRFRYPDLARAGQRHRLGRGRPERGRTAAPAGRCTPGQGEWRHGAPRGAGRWQDTGGRGGFCRVAARPGQSPRHGRAGRAVCASAKARPARRGRGARRGPRHGPARIRLSPPLGRG